MNEFINFEVNVPIIQVLIFRGTGGVYNVNHPYHNEPALVRAGHVGIKGVIADKIIGFHPTSQAADAIGGEKELLLALKAKIPQPGCLQDDDEYFERATELSYQTNGRTIVYMYEVEIEENTLTAMQSWYNNRREALYSFPDDDGQFEHGECNCAIFWQRFSIPLPVVSGNIREIVQIMIEEEYDIWLND